MPGAKDRNACNATDVAKPDSCHNQTVNPKVVMAEPVNDRICPVQMNVKRRILKG